MTTMGVIKQVNQDIDAHETEKKIINFVVIVGVNSSH